MKKTELLCGDGEISNPIEEKVERVKTKLITTTKKAKSLSVVSRNQNRHPLCNAMNNSRTMSRNSLGLYTHDARDYDAKESVTFWKLELRNPGRQGQ